jgi:hypothetical protein
MCGHFKVRSEGDASACEGNVGLDMERLSLALVWCGRGGGASSKGFLH